MQFVADILLGAGALAAAAYCLVLSRRLRQFTRLESGMGSAIAVLSAQVDDMTRALARAQETAAASAAKLEAERELAERAARRIELLVASLHDLPQGAAQGGTATGGGPAAAPTRPPGREGEAARPETPWPASPAPGWPGGGEHEGVPRRPATAGAGDAAGAEAERRARFVRHRVSRAGQEAAE